MKKTILSLAMLSFFVACTESLEDKAAREVKEYTEKYCPTPITDNSRTDSATFDKASRTFTYYFTLSGPADNAQIISANKQKLYDVQKDALDNNPSLKKYKEAGFKYHFVYRSASKKDMVLIDFFFL